MEERNRETVDWANSVRWSRVPCLGVSPKTYHPTVLVILPKNESVKGCLEARMVQKELNDMD